MFFELSEEVWLNLSHVVKIVRTPKNDPTKYTFYGVGERNELGFVSRDDPARFNTVTGLLKLRP